VDNIILSACTNHGYVAGYDYIWNSWDVEDCLTNLPSPRNLLLWWWDRYRLCAAWCDL